MFLGAGLCDGQWHEVRFLAKENFAVLTIDGDESSSVRSNSPLKVLTGEKYLFGGKISFKLFSWRTAFFKQYLVSLEEIFLVKVQVILPLPVKIQFSFRD